MAATILTSVFANGGRAARYGEFTIVTMHGSAFVTTPMEFHQHQNWARGRASTGNATRDRTLFVDRFDTLIGRDGSGIASKGSPMVLLRIVKAMKAAAMFMESWNVPRNLGVGVEIVKKPKPKVAASEPVAAAAVAVAPVEALAPVAPVEPTEPTPTPT